MVMEGEAGPGLGIALSGLLTVPWGVAVSCRGVLMLDADKPQRGALHSLQGHGVGVVCAGRRCTMGRQQEELGVLGTPVSALPTSMSPWAAF